ncbi:MAG: cyclase family protein [Verrucomicrobia bacterium]|nr:cyclase family protein [Verrucomicrobiota bacterium]
MKAVFKSYNTTLIALLAVIFQTAHAGDSGTKQWVKGQGWGWVWGPENEIGALNEMTDESMQAALSLATNGKINDLGVIYDRDHSVWPGHSPAEEASFSSPEGVKRQADFPSAIICTAWHSCALFTNDDGAAQIDDLRHSVESEDNRENNDLKESDLGDDSGVRKFDATTIPKIVARGVLIDVADYKGVAALPPHYGITIVDIKGALNKQGTMLLPGDVVLIRTGAIQYWSDPLDREKLADHDTAGLLYESARWLVEERGAMLIGSDTSGLEYRPAPEDAVAYQKKHESFMPVHDYLLTQQGVHIGELYYLEDLAADKAYEFCYICPSANTPETTRGSTPRPIAMR